MVELHDLTETTLPSFLVLLVAIFIPFLLPLMLQSPRGSARRESLLPLYNSSVGDSVRNIALRSHPSRIPEDEEYSCENPNGSVDMMKVSARVLYCAKSVLIARVSHCNFPFTQQDNSSAAKLGGEEVWNGVNCGMCAVHVFYRWFDKNKKYWNDRSTDKGSSFSMMSADFEKYRDCSIFNLVNDPGLLFDKMIAKWSRYFLTLIVLCHLCRC